MKNPIPGTPRDVIYTVLVVLGILVANAPAVIIAVQTGDWNGAAASLSGTIGILAGIVAKANLTPDTPE